MLPEVDLYLRKSKIVRDEDPRDLTSIRAQEERGRAWAAQNGLRVRHVWVDNLSAWSDVRRPEFDRALAAVLAGDVPCLWCAYLDRFSRKGIDDIGPILGKARVVFDYEGLDSANERDRRWIIDRAEQAREFSMRLSHNARTTKQSQRDRGMWLGQAPYGLEIDDRRSRKLRHSADWPTVERIITLLADGLSQRLISRTLNSEGVTSPDGGQWQASTVSMILHNPVYEGWQVVRQRNTRLEYRNAAGDRVSVFAEGSKPLSTALVAKARSRIVVTGRGNHRSHLLSRWTSCAGCGGPCPCNGSSYVCSGHAIGKICPAPASVSLSALEAYVRDRWVARLSGADDDDPLLVTVAKRYGLVSQPGSAEAVRDATDALKAAQSAVQRLSDQVAKGIFDPPFDTHLPRLQREHRAALVAAQERADAVAPRTVDISFLREADSAREAWDSAEIGLRRDFVGLAIRRITITKGSRGCRFDGAARVTIDWQGDEA